MTTRSTVLTLAVLALCAGSAGAQQAPTIPIRPLGPILSKSTETFLHIAGVRGVAGGVLVNDPPRRRLVRLDSALQVSVVVADSLNAKTIYAQRGVGIIRFTGDSTLYVDVTSLTMLVVDPAGNVMHAVAAPKAPDMQFLVPFVNGPLGIGPMNTMPGIDARGGLIYAAQFRRQPTPPTPGQTTQTQVLSPDSVPLVRGDFNTRTIDTLWTLRSPAAGTATVTVNPATGQPSKFVIKYNPIQVYDDWAVLSDGTIAIVRAQDYHIDWIDPDGTKRTTGKMPFDWRRLTDEEKQYFADSSKKWLQGVIDSVMQTAGKPPFTPEVTVAKLDDIPNFLSPVGATRADLDGNIWILPTTSLAARGGRLYDVVNRKGEIVERVQFPPGRALEGFGPGGIVYLSLKVGNDTYLERARLR